MKSYDQALNEIYSINDKLQNHKTQTKGKIIYSCCSCVFLLVISLSICVEGVIKPPTDDGNEENADQNPVEDSKGDENILGRREYATKYISKRWKAEHSC